MTHIEASTEPVPATAEVNLPRTKNKLTLIVFSGDLDRVLAAFNLATGAAAMGMEATVFFTFWGLNVLKKNSAIGRPQGLMKRMLGRMNRGGTDRLHLSKFHMGGMGTWMMNKLMRQHQMPSVDEMIALAKQLGVKLVACTITMGIMGIQNEDLIPEVDSFAGVITYLSEAREGAVNLFI